MAQKIPNGYRNNDESLLRVNFLDTLYVQCTCCTHKCVSLKTSQYKNTQNFATLHRLQIAAYLLTTPATDISPLTSVLVTSVKAHKFCVIELTFANYSNLHSMRETNCVLRLVSWPQFDHSCPLSASV